MGFFKPHFCNSCYIDGVTDFARYIATRLDPWFRQNHRDLAWRRTRDPYAIWVSEIMLQQTRVDTVKDYYPRFLKRFPDVGTLAAADQASVLEAWSGLGYYRRARLLHRGAKYVADECGGKVPDRVEALRKVPGIGPYTAGAVASIAFDRPAALVDGNVARVLSRLQGVQDPKHQDAKAAGHWQAAQAILEAAKSPRIVAQALMELGATVCTPANPTCLMCPVRPRCVARARGLTSEIPAPKKRAPSPRDDLWAVAIYSGKNLLVHKRPDKGLLAGMWCLPLIPREGNRGRGGKGVSLAAVRRQTGLRVRAAKELETMVKHVFTHRVWELHPCRVEVVGRPELAANYAWIDPGTLPAGGVPKVTKKLLAALDWGSRPAKSA